MTVRGYARVAGAALVLLAFVGLVGAWQVLSSVDTVLHLCTGALLGYAGFARVGERVVRAVVGGVGALYLVEGLVGPLKAFLDELPVLSYDDGEDVAHVLFGLICLFAATLLPSDSEGPTSDP
jgi:hypothetical protein